MLQRRTNRPRVLPRTVVAITRGARGIGLATARALAREGACVAIADLDATVAANVSSAIAFGPVAPPTVLPALMNAPDGLRECRTLRPLYPAFRNEVIARVAPAIAACRPGRAATMVTYPILFCISTADTVTSLDETERCALTAARGEVKHYEAGHFECYLGESSQHLVSDQIKFLARHLCSAESAA